MTLPRLAALAAVFCLATPAVADAARTMSIRANVKMLPGGGSALLQSGTFTGAPLGSGTVRVRTYVGRGRGSVVKFTLSNSRGSVSGTGDCAVTFRGAQISYRGTAKITSGTGAFRNIRGRGLRVTGSGSISGERFTVNVSGRISG
jgi:hypothetical protein